MDKGNEILSTLRLHRYPPPSTLIYPVSVDPYSIQVRHPRVCKDEAHWLVVELVIPGPMSFVLTYSVRSYLDTLGVHANWIDYTNASCWTLRNKMSYNSETEQEAQ